MKNVNKPTHKPIGAGNKKLNKSGAASSGQPPSGKKTGAQRQLTPAEQAALQQRLAQHRAREQQANNPKLQAKKPAQKQPPKAFQGNNKGKASTFPTGTKPGAGIKKPKAPKGETPLGELELEYMDDANAAMLMRSPTGGRRLIIFSLLAVLVGLIWAGFAEIDEITRGNGQVVPSSRTQVIQNLEGGILEAVFVREGDVVEKDQALMQLDDTRFSSSFRGREAEYYGLLAKVARLKAEVDNQSLSYLTNALKGYTEYAERELDIFISRREAQASELGIIEEQVEQRRQELAEARSRLTHLDRAHELGLKEYRLTKPLAERGVVSEVELIQLQQRINQLEGDAEAIALSIPRLESVVAEQQAKKTDLDLEFRSQAVEELKEAEVKLAQLQEERTSLADQVNRTEVRSPVAGIVKKINITTAGGVIQPGMELMEIVPLDDTLLIEAKIRPQDIAFIRLGLGAVVKFSAYDFAIYGGLKGTVEHISADTIEDKEGESFYIVRLRTDKHYLGSQDKPLPIIPGMQCTVDIITGQKTVLDYLLKPILRARELALTER